MKELWISIVTTYENYRGTGKLIGLFLAAVLIIYLINNDKADDKETGIKENINPGLFLLSVWSGIAYAFTCIYEKMTSRRTGKLYSAIVCLLFVLAIILSGKRVFSNEFMYQAENTMHVRDEYVAVMDRILAENDSYVKIVSAPSMIPYFKMYSSKLNTIYDYPRNGDLELLDKDERYVYEQMSLSTPDEKKVVDVMREKDCNYLLYNTSKTYFELPLEGFGFELVDEVGEYKIYRDLGGIE